MVCAITFGGLVGGRPIRNEAPGERHRHWPKLVAKPQILGRWRDRNHLRPKLRSKKVIAIMRSFSGKGMAELQKDEREPLYCPACKAEGPDPLVCGDCGAVICRKCGTPLEKIDELGIG